MYWATSAARKDFQCSRLVTAYSSCLGKRSGYKWHSTLMADTGKQGDSYQCRPLILVILYDFKNRLKAVRGVFLQSHIWSFLCFMKWSCKVDFQLPITCAGFLITSCVFLPLLARRTLLFQTSVFSLLLTQDSLSALSVLLICLICMFLF